MKVYNTKKGLLTISYTRLRYISHAYVDQVSLNWSPTNAVIMQPYMLYAHHLHRSVSKNAFTSVLSVKHYLTEFRSFMCSLCQCCVHYEIRHISPLFFQGSPWQPVHPDPWGSSCYYYKTCISVRLTSQHAKRDLNINIQLIFWATSVFEVVKRQYKIRQCIQEWFSILEPHTVPWEI